MGKRIKRKAHVGKTADGHKLWQVERIVGHCTTSEGKMEYQVKWLGWPAYENTWEPEVNLQLLDALAEYKASRPEFIQRTNPQKLKIVIPARRNTTSLETSNPGCESAGPTTS